MNLTQDEMFELTFQRPPNYFQLHEKSRWEIDKKLGILDWDGKMTPEQNKRYRAHWGVDPVHEQDWKIYTPDVPETIKQAKLKEAVNHPQHYGGKNNPYEAIKVIKAWKLGFELGNAVKYICRAGKKDPAKELEDLEKAVWYLQSRINDLKPEEEEDEDYVRARIGKVDTKPAPRPFGG